MEVSGQVYKIQKLINESYNQPEIMGVFKN